MTKQIKTNLVFHPQEHAIIAHYLDITPPDGTPDIESISFDDDKTTRVGLKTDSFGNQELDSAVSDAVARIALGTVEDRLPQWGCVHEDGRVTLARSHPDSPTFTKRSVISLSQHLFEINWADSGPGYSWPEAFYVTYLPYYDVFVVTGSADSPDARGYCDRSLGFFSPDKDTKEGSREIIQADWREQYEGWDQQHWAYLFYTGLVSEEEAYEWAAAIWRLADNDEVVGPVGLEPTTNGL